MLKGLQKCLLGVRGSANTIVLSTQGLSSLLGRCLFGGLSGSSTCSCVCRALKRKITEKRSLQALLSPALTSVMRISCRTEQDPLSSIGSQRLLFNQDVSRWKQTAAQPGSSKRSQFQISAFSPPAMGGMAELQLSWVTGKQPVEIPLSVSMSSPSSPRKEGRKKQFTHSWNVCGPMLKERLVQLPSQGVSNASKFCWTLCSSQHPQLVTVKGQN